MYIHVHLVGVENAHVFSLCFPCVFPVFSMCFPCVLHVFQKLFKIMKCEIWYEKYFR